MTLKGSRIFTDGGQPGSARMPVLRPHFDPAQRSPRHREAVRRSAQLLLTSKDPCLLTGQFGSDQIWFGWLCPQASTWRVCVLPSVSATPRHW